MEVIPWSVVPLTGVSTASVAEIPSATPLTALEKTVELDKSMEEMNLQETEISRLKKEIENLQELKSSYQTSYSKEKQTSDQLNRNCNNFRSKQWQAKHWLRSKKVSGWTSPSP